MVGGGGAGGGEKTEFNIEITIVHHFVPSSNRLKQKCARLLSKYLKQKQNKSFFQVETPMIIQNGSGCTSNKKKKINAFNILHQTVFVYCCGCASTLLKHSRFLKSVGFEKSGVTQRD